MDDRLVLHGLLVSVYPELTLYYRPTNFELEYPCIVYDQLRVLPQYSENSPYVTGTMFEVTVMTLLPEMIDAKKMLSIPGTRHSRSFTKDNIVHDVYSIRVGAT